MSCKIKNIFPGLTVTEGNLGNNFELDIDFYDCAMAPEYYLILEESTPTDEIPLFTQHPRFIEVFEEDIA